MDRDQKIRDFGYKVAFGTLFLAPAIMLLPPRKLDFYTFGLGATWLYCLTHVVEHHGIDIYGPLTGRRFTSTAEQALRTRRAEEESGLSVSERMMKDIKDVWNQDMNRTGVEKGGRLVGSDTREGRMGVVESVEELRKERGKG